MKQLETSAPRREGWSLSAIAIRRQIGTLMLALTVIVLGWFYLNRLPVDLLPSITYPRIGLRLDTPGLSPEVAVDEVTRPLEQALSATEGVTQVFSQTREGRVSIDLFFQPGGNIDRALNDATATFNRARSSLPDTVETARLFKADPSQLPVYEFALTSPQLQDVDLRVFADEELARELSVVPGVAGVDVSGGVREEIQVNLDLNRLQALGVGLTEVLNALEQRNQDISGGRLRATETEPLTRTLGRFQTAAEIRDLSFELGPNSLAPEAGSAAGLNGTTPLASPRRVYLRDFAQVLDGTESQRVRVFLNGQPAVKLSIQKQPEANTVTVVEGVKQRLEQLRQGGIIPPDMVLTATLDESVFIRNAIQNVATAGFSGAVLAGLAVLVFLGSLRQTLIIVLAIPLATLTAMILMGVFGLSINIFSLGGLALGVGIVVDNSIVMLENIAVGVTQVPRPRLGRPGPQILDRAIASSKELESALVASTATNLVAVLPFLLIGGFFSLLFNELILTISFAVAASLVVALTVVPMLASRLLGISWSSGIGKLWLLQAFNHRFNAATAAYQRFLALVLRWRRLAIAIAVVILGSSSFWMVGQIPQEIVPRIDTGQVRLVAQFPPGTTLEANQQVMTAVDQILQQQPETEYVFTTVGGFLFGTSTSENLLRSSSTITLKPGSDLNGFIEQTNRALSQLNLVDTRLRLSPEALRGLVLSNSPVRGAEIDLTLQGADAKLLAQAGRQVLAALDEQVTLARFRPDADALQPEIQIRPDWERVASFGLTAQEVGETIQTAIQGTVPTQLQRGNRLVNVRVQLAQATLQRPAQLRQLPLFVENNRQIRLSDVAQIELGQAPGEIQRLNQRQVFLIAGTLQEGARLSQALEQVDTTLNQLDLPAGISFPPSQTALTTQQLQTSLVLLAGLAVFLVFVVMAVQYNSLLDPLVILLTVPLALAGGILGLYLTQTAIGATVIVGVVLLVGIVVNNAIILVELANQIREQEGVDAQTAILRAAPQRLRPVLMTTITTVLGLFPLALGLGAGAEFLQPLGVVVFSGLSLATVLTLLIIPCFYVLLKRG